MSAPTQQQLMAIKFVADAIVDAVKAAGTAGAPGGVLYSALVGKLTLDQFNSFMGALVSTGRLRRQGDLYFAS